MVKKIENALNRRSVVKAILKDRGEKLLVTGLGSPSYDAHAAGDNVKNFYLWGAMGGAAMVGLGLAISQKEKKIMVITGDGEQLMGLGGMATIGVQNPKNLILIVLDNMHYGETGMQKSHTFYGIDLCKIALASGFKHSFEILNNDQLNEIIRFIEKNDGPIFVNIKVSDLKTSRSLPIVDGIYCKNRFRRAIGFSPL